MRAQSWGPFLILLMTPFVVGVGGEDGDIPRVLAFIGAFVLMMPLRDLVVRRGRARRGSIVEAADARRPWLAALASALLLMSLRLPNAVETEPRALALARVAVGAAFAVLLVLDVRALVRLGRGVARAHALEPRTPGSPPPDRATLVIDFGVGEGELEELAPPAAVYRDPPRLVRLVRGSLPAARRSLLGGIAFDVAVLVPSLVALACWLVAGGILQ